MAENSLEARIQRLEDVREIENLMARRAFKHSAGRHDLEIADCWSRKRDDVSIELEEWGLWEGQESVYKCYVEGNPHPGGAPGMMVEHALTTEVIEVAGDRQTAKGVWLSPGHETIPIDGKPVAMWCWNRYGIDFILEDGEWKIWHMHVYSVIRTPYTVDWVSASIERPAGMPGPDDLPTSDFHRPDRPKTFNQPYSIHETRALEPKPPEPYQTFADTWSYTEPPDAEPQGDS